MYPEHGHGIVPVSCQPYPEVIRYEQVAPGGHVPEPYRVLPLQHGPSHNTGGRLNLPVHEARFGFVKCSGHVRVDLTDPQVNC